MGQTSSRPRPSIPSPLSCSSSRITDISPTLSSNNNSDLSNQTTRRRTKRKSILGTLRSPLRHSLNHQSTTTPEGDTPRTKTHRRWTLYGRRKPTEATRAPPVHDEAQPPESPSSPPATTADPKGKAKEDNPAVSTTELVGPTTAGPSSSNSSNNNTSQLPFLGTATDLSSSSSSSPSSRDSVAALNHDPRTPLPTIAIQPDTPSHDNPEPFDVMERPATPPDPAQVPTQEPRRNFPAAGTLVVVQGVVHTSDVSQSPNSSDPTDNTASHPTTSPVPERPPRRRFSDLLTRPIRSRRSSYAAPESQSSETTVSTDSENQEVSSSATSEASQEQPVQEETPVPASRPLSLSPTSIDVLGTLLRYVLPCLP